MLRITPHNLQHTQTSHRPSLAVAKSFASFTLCACVLAIAGWSSSADAVGLGNLDVRSYLGEPLNLRIGVITQQNEEIETGCFAVINAPGSEANVSRRDVRLTLVETRNSRYLEVRGTNAFNEPIGRLSIRAGCQADSGVVRDYPLLLDPAPLLAPPIANSEVAVNSTARVTVQSSTVNAGNDAAAARWTVYEGDTFSSLARGIHPGDRARQNQYIVALRALNPALAGIANNAPLPLNSQLVLPDLKTLSSAANRAMKTGERTRREPGVATRNARPKVVADKALRPLTAQAALPTATTRAPTPTAEEKNPAKADAAPKAPEPKKAAAADGFRLRISGGDLDLSRSQGITDETRAQLRERFAALDADDQTAQLLALKNTVKQIEKRLNEMQLKMATLPASGALGATPAEPAPVVAPAVPPVVEKAPSEVTAAAKPATMPAPTPALSPTPPAPPKATEPVKPANRGNTSTDFTPLIVIALSILALAALVWWVLKRRAANSLVEGQQTRGKNSSSDEFNTWVNDPDTELPGETEAPKTARSSSRDRTASKSASLRNDNGLEKTEATQSTNRFAADGAARSTAHTEASAGASALALSSARDQDTESRGKPYTNPHAPTDAGFTLPSAAPLSPLSTPDRAKADSKPVTTSDLLKTTDTFDLDLDLDQQASSTSSTDQTSEDRLRRLRYMHERYPELAARTVSIDEPESVIHAARLYYEDNQLGKACELLIYAVEERPQETRFWLAQFELFRLEKMATQFTDLAQKFELLFGADKSWQKVQQAGWGLDPSNPLFSGASGSDQFDAAAENWLDAPAGGDAATQNISEALIADLRASLFAEHRVTHADFERGPALLNSMGERGQG
jgi:pilus assembly protein FimV